MVLCVVVNTCGFERGAEWTTIIVDIFDIIQHVVWFDGIIKLLLIV